MEETFTIEEIRNYIQSQNSLGDVLYNLKKSNIKKANKTIEFTLEEILENGNNWDSFCEKYGINEYAVKEGFGDSKIRITITDCEKFGLI